jgi:hypothetical protein
MSTVIKFEDTDGEVVDPKYDELAEELDILARVFTTECYEAAKKHGIKLRVILQFEGGQSPN